MKTLHAVTLVGCLAACQGAWSADLPVSSERITHEQSEAYSVDIERLNDLHQRWNLAVNSGDVDGVLAVLDEDIELIPPDAPELFGKAAFGQMLEGVFDSNTFRIEVLAPEDIHVSSDIAWSRYNYRIHRSPKHGTTVFTDERRYLDVFRRQPDGEWLVLKHIWNYPGPAPVPGS